MTGSAGTPASDQKCTSRTEELADRLRRMADGDAFFWTSKNCPDDLRESDLEDILAFESVASGTSLFQGLQEHGVDLPPPETLNEQQSAAKVTEVLHALARLRIFLVGFDDMTARESYSTIWNQTLWEGCYIEKRNPEACTLIDVSHSMSRESLQQVLEELTGTGSVN